MKISIVIPTRNRSEFLPYCVKTCLASDDRDIEVVVSDNNSADDTPACMAAIKDDRLVYRNTGRDLSMRQNFEFALTHTTGDYVIYIGDDDGIIPNGLATLRKLLITRRPDVALWRHITYFWPRTYPAQTPGVLKFRYRDFCGPMHLINPKQRLAELAQARLTNYRDGANIYHGCVSRNVIERVRVKQAGVYFNGVCPDVNTAISNLTQSKTILWFRNPVTIGGASEKSNGSAFNGKESASKQQKQIASDFTKLVAIDGIQPEIDTRIRSIPAQTYANLCLINKQTRGGYSTIDHTAWRRVITEDLYTYAPEMRCWDVMSRFFETFDSNYQPEGLPADQTSELEDLNTQNLHAQPDQPDVIAPASRKRRRYTDENVATVYSVVQWIQAVTGQPYSPSAISPLATLKQAGRIPGMWRRARSLKRV